MIKHIFLIALLVVTFGLGTLLLALPTPDKTNSHKTQETSKNVSANIQTNHLLITQVRLFDGQQISENKSVRIIDGEISLIADNIEALSDELVVNGKGKTLLPGLIDSHTHTYGSGLSDALRFGVSAHLDMFTMETTLANSRKKRDDMSYTNQTDLYSSGTMATVAGGHGTQYGFTIDTIDSIDEINDWVSKRKNAGADYIKLVYMPYQSYMPSLDRESAKELIKQAHQQGLKALAHISTQAAAKDMIEDGIDGLVHIFADTPVKDEVLNLAVKNEIFIIPTLAVIASVDSRGLAQSLAQQEGIKARLSAQQKSTLLTSFGTDIPGFDFDVAKQNVKRFFDAGVPILAGSDAPNSGTAFGVSLHHEIMLLNESGLSGQQAIAAATKLPARIFNLDRGSIALGERADLVLVEGNPFSELRDILNIHSVYKNGYKVDTSVAAADSQAKKLSDILLSNFEQNSLATLDEFTWSKSDDSMTNGQSAATIAMALDKDKQSHVLVVTAKIDPTFAYPWAGAAVGDFVPPIMGYDISDSTQLTFDIKGTPGTYRIMAFDATAAGIPPTQTITVSEQWQTFTISMDGFEGFNPKAFSGLAIVAGPELGDYTFKLDKVRID